MIVVDDVYKRFGKVTALAGVSLRIDAGSRVALVGSNGSGKTTLIRALCGLVRVSGRIEIGGVDVRARPELALRNLAYVPQTAPPLDAPVAELVRAWTHLRGIELRKVRTLAERLGLALDAVAKSRVRDLSGGMKQKLLAALALAVEAPVLVCDEPTASLDAAARAAFFELVRLRRPDSVLVLCSHRAEEVEQLVDRVVELADGALASDTLLRTGAEAASAVTVTRLLRRVR
jgi:ABC-2 type transport system ATP-binding protein